MLELGDIYAAYEVWIAAGLKPPNSSQEAQKIIAQKTLAQYRHTDINDWAQAVDWVANNNTRWVTWFDINTALSIVRQNKIGAEKKEIERTNKQANEFVKKIFADLAAGRRFKDLCQPLSDKVIQTAKRIFPDAGEGFIRQNQSDIGYIADVDRNCAGCISTTECPYSGHQPFLKVDKDGGYTYIVVDRERCYKYHTKAG